MRKLRLDSDKWSDKDLTKLLERIVDISGSINSAASALLGYSRFAPKPKGKRAMMVRKKPPASSVKRSWRKKQ